jgi:hypothetical protein
VDDIYACVFLGTDGLGVKCISGGDLLEGMKGTWTDGSNGCDEERGKSCYLFGEKIGVLW